MLYGKPLFSGKPLPFLICLLVVRPNLKEKVVYDKQQYWRTLFMHKSF